MEFKNTLILFPCDTSFSSFWSVKYLNFWQKNYRFGQLIIVLWKVDTLRLCFVQPPKPNTHFLASCSWANKGRWLLEKNTKILKPSFKLYLSFNISYNFNYLYIRENKRPAAWQDFYYNQQFNYNILNCCCHLCCGDISKGGTKNCCAYRMHEICSWLPCKKTLALDFLHLR